MTLLSLISLASDIWVDKHARRSWMFLCPVVFTQSLESWEYELVHRLWAVKAEVSHGWVCSPAGEMAHPIALEIVEYPQSQCLDSLKGLLQPEWTETSVSPSWNSFKREWGGLSERRQTKNKITMGSGWHPCWQNWKQCRKCLPRCKNESLIAFVSFYQISKAKTYCLVWAVFG